MRTVGHLVVVGLLASACAAGAEGADDVAATIDEDDAASAVDPTTNPPVVAEAPPGPDAVDPVDPVDGPGTVTDPAPSSIPDATPAATPDAVDDEPVFEIEPPRPFDRDLAVFPPDDAGLGGGGDGVAVPSGSSPPLEAVPLTGWAAFDASLAAALVRPGNTAASVAVMIDGDVVHTAGFGSRTLDRVDPVEPRDRFRIASISKVVTAIVLLQLVEDGVVGLDEPIGDRLATHLGVSSGAPSLTVRRLLTHTSGYGKYQSTFFRRGAVDCDDAARRGLRDGAGSGGYVYSNMNYCLAGELIEALTGLGYEDAAYRYLLTPLGLSGLRLAPTIDPGPDEVQHVTTPGRNYMETLGGAGAWIASPTDLVTILDSLDHTTDGFKPLQPETVAEMFTPPGAAPGQRGYGLGIISYGFGRHGHTGTIESTHAMAMLRGDGVTWAVTVAGRYPGESTALESIVNRAFEAGGFIAA